MQVKFKKLSVIFRIMIVFAILIGTVLGGGLAYASHLYYHDLSYGWNTINDLAMYYPNYAFIMGAYLYSDNSDDIWVEYLRHWAGWSPCSAYFSTCWLYTGMGDSYFVRGFYAKYVNGCDITVDIKQWWHVTDPNGYPLQYHVIVAWGSQAASEDWVFVP